MSWRNPLTAAISAGMVEGNWLVWLPGSSCYSWLIFCASELLVIGDREAETTNLLFLSLQFSLMSSEKNIHCRCRGIKLVKILFLPSKPYSFPCIWIKAVCHNIITTYLSLTVEYCQHRKYLLLANRLFAEWSISYKSRFAIPLLLPPFVPFLVHFMLWGTIHQPHHHLLTN